MSRLHIVDSGQPQLPLEDAAGSKTALRDVFQRSGLPAQGYSFARAMATPAVRLALENVQRAPPRERNENEQIHCPAGGS